MAQYGGEQLMKPEGYQTEEYAHNNPLHSTTTAAHNIGGTGTNMGMGAGHGGQEVKHGGGGGILNRSGSGSSSSSEDDGEGGRRKKKGMMGKIKEKLPGGDHGSDEHKTSATETIDGGVGVGGYEGAQGETIDGGVGVGGYEGAEGHEKKGLMEKIKEKLPGGH